MLVSKLGAASSCINKKASCNYSSKLKASDSAAKNLSKVQAEVELLLRIQIGTSAVEIEGNFSGFTFMCTSLSLTQTEISIFASLSCESCRKTKSKNC